MKSSEVCDACGAPIIGHEKHEERHFSEDGITRLVFCSYECQLEHHEQSIQASAERTVRREANELHKVVCPACRRRIRERF